MLNLETYIAWVMDVKPRGILSENVNHGDSVSVPDFYVLVYLLDEVDITNRKTPD